jgi:pimeloyl-ACP methyl ester carboxylesterase
MHTHVSFDGTRIAYHDEGDGPTVILLHGFGVDALGQFGEFEHILPRLEKRQEMFRLRRIAVPSEPPPEGRLGLARALLAAGARTILPDMRGFGASDKPRERSAYETSAHSRDVVALIDHLHLDAVDVIGYSMGCGTAARLLALHPPQVKSAILAGVGDYVLEDNVMEFPKNWPIPDSVTEADPKVLAAVIRGAVMPTWPVEALRTIEVPVLILNGRADAANQKIDGLLGTIPTARVASCEGDHLSTPTSRHSIQR